MKIVLLKRVLPAYCKPLFEAPREQAQLADNSLRYTVDAGGAYGR